ncbi:hypothetical protein REJC140_00169 [Pseudorhizobium endolithicum]|uniref:Uncharacterized protein n=1 Tax=Pseudorhizobium endolithicum TaxID=1191678 RepID=A0ABN7JEA3_9HYPH|nr:hypothetical protein [Pseudorhizobium endolithicum]CAD6412731.1 hypothetical protein REQ54_01055 [Rhizobium sp. Q54]CAD7023328.1 hypothetical protein REJC140_00169 [Pseudorhizobium endolithicum]
MTSPALVRAADLKRMADVAKAKNVTVWIEINGRRIGVSPDLPPIDSGAKPTQKYEDFDL